MKLPKNHTMKISMLTTAVFLFFCLTSAAQQLRPVELHGALRTEGNQMVNKDGIPPQLRGISLSWSLWAGKKYYNPEVIDWLTKDFKINLLRASMGVQPEGGYLENHDEQMKLMTTVIDRAISNGIYVLIDWHDHNADLHLEASKAFFTTMAKKYSGVPNVIYEIFNEPAQQKWDVIKAYSVEVIKTILHGGIRMWISLQPIRLRVSTTLFIRFIFTLPTLITRINSVQRLKWRCHMELHCLLQNGALANRMEMENLIVRKQPPG